MNNEASSSIAGNPPPIDDASRPEADAATNGSSAVVDRKRKLLEPLERKAKFISELMYQLDLTIYAELVFLYYLEYVHLQTALLSLVQIFERF